MDQQKQQAHLDTLERENSEKSTEKNTEQNSEQSTDLSELSTGSVVFLHDFSTQEILTLVSSVKKLFPHKDIAFTKTTPNNIHFTVSELIKDVRADHEYLQKNPPEWVQKAKAKQKPS